MVAAILEVASTGATKAVRDDPPNQDVSPYACRVDTASAVASLMFVGTSGPLFFGRDRFMPRNGDKSHKSDPST